VQSEYSTMYRQAMLGRLMISPAWPVGTIWYDTICDLKNISVPVTRKKNTGALRKSVDRISDTRKCL
jgi:hypothetical protein